MRMMTGGVWKLGWGLLLAAALGGAELPSGRVFVIGDTLGGDPILREAVIRWSLDHAGNFEICRLSPAALGRPDNGCDAAVTDAGDELIAGSEVCRVPYALDAAVAAVPENSPVRGLSGLEIKRIYSGRIANWSQLGYPDCAVVRAGVVRNAPGERAFVRLIMGWGALDEAAPSPGDDILPGMIFYRTPAEAGVLAAGTPGLIVFGSAALAGVPGLRVLPVDGVAPTAENIRSGKYRFVLTRTVCFRRDSPLRDLLMRLPEFRAGRAGREADFLAPPGEKTAEK